jgi:hypothetical protein
MAKIVKFEDFKKEEEVDLQDLKRDFTKNSADTQQFPRNTKFHYNDVTKKMDDLSVDEVDDKIEGLEESKIYESKNKSIEDLKEWLKKRELPTKLGGNIRMVDANVLLKYIEKNYTLTKK